MNFNAEIEAKVKLVRDRMAYRIEKRLVESTPVDTSQARSNWIATRNTVSSYSPVTTQVPTSSTIAAAAAVIQQTKAYENLQIINNVPYIVYLAEGSSSQNPTKFVEIIVAQEAARAGT